MKLKNILLAAIGSAVLSFNTAAYANWVSVSPTASPFTISYVQGKKTKIATITYSPSPAAAIWYSNDSNTDVGNQSPANVETIIESQFATTVNFVSACDNPTSNCTNATGNAGAGGWDNTYLSQAGFNYLAVHFGNKELLFHWSNLINQFSISGLPNGLSNYRAYSDIQTNEVPLPAAAWLFGSALLGFAGFKRRI